MTPEPVETTDTPVTDSQGEAQGWRRMNTQLYDHITYWEHPDGETLGIPAEVEAAIRAPLRDQVRATLLQIEEARAKWAEQIVHTGTEYNRAVAAEAKVAELERKHKVIDSNGHYCDGMDQAWSDAQQAIMSGAASRQLTENLQAAVREHLRTDHTLPGDQCSDCGLMGCSETCRMYKLRRYSEIKP